MRKFSLVIILFIGVLFVQCGTKREKPKTISKPFVTKPVEVENQENAELEKAIEFGVKSRKTFSYFYTNKGTVGENGVPAEEIDFNNKGLKTDYWQYVSGGYVDVHNTYEYDDNDNLVTTTTYNSNNSIVYKRESEFDNEGRETARRELNLKSNNYDETKSKYDKNHNLLELITYAPTGDIKLKQQFQYDSTNKMISGQVFELGKREIDNVTFQYDSLGRLEKEIHKRPNTNNGIVTYKYDDKGRMTEVNWGYVKRIFEYYDSGDLKMEVMYDDTDALQQKFKYTYDQRGLLAEKIRYDGMDKPAIYIKYEYEFY